MSMSKGKDSKKVSKDFERKTSS